MKISTRGRYALRLMMDLAANDTGEFITIKSIAERQEISEKYLEQIISILNKAGCVFSARGSQGGYKLAKKPSEYTVGEILRITEGSIAPVICTEEEQESCHRTNCCAAREVWEKLYEAIKGVVDNITLQDLVNRQKVLDMEAYNYMI